VKVCVFEWLSGGGCWLDRQTLPGVDAERSAILIQGRSMREAFAADLSRAGHEVFVLHDSRLESRSAERIFTSFIASASDLKPVLVDLALQSDAVFLVAPETGGRLLSVCQWFDGLPVSLRSPDADFVELASDKYATSKRLAAHGVPVPMACQFRDVWRLLEGNQIRFPLVSKPNDGAGSECVKRIASYDELDKLQAAENLLFEPFVPGIPASVSVLHYGESFELLPATRQLFDAEPFGQYVGAEYPLPPHLAARAADLATRVVRALPPTRGYYGIDMVLGETSHAEDHAIEINPRLTMSYLKLRQICHFNIADRILKKLAQPTVS
jgi:predicted ATP-grasp superfamily ATP-dependent carboligase